MKGTYEQRLIYNFMDEWWAFLDELVQELREQGFEVLSSNREAITVSVDDDGDYVELRLVLGGTERTITVEDFEEVYREEG
jgi:hypothetical protein